MFRLVRRRPCSALLPYTTLFRSVRARGESLERREEHGRDRDGEHALRKHVEAEGGIDRRRGAVLVDQPRDRKSTRLNSSHQITSYAVLCLKTTTCTRRMQSTVA